MARVKPPTVAVSQGVQCQLLILRRRDNDGSLGPVIPYLIRTYEIDTNMVEILSLTQYLDLGTLLIVGAARQILAHVLRFWLPPLPLYAVTFFLISLGQAYNDTHANNFVSTLPAAHRSLGFIHAMYMAGCLVGPLIATAVASANTHSQWNLFYAFPLGIGVANLALVAIAFRDRFEWMAQVRPAGPSTHEGRGKAAWAEIRATLSTRGVWLLGLFSFFFLGATITASGTATGAILSLFTLTRLRVDGGVSGDCAGGGHEEHRGINVGSRIFAPEIRSSAIGKVF
ncbi:MFS general substrate transporter [Aspergillus affinis]|uniref:MFS general substrate transporter n=1 Tax=Aspergillus affinis TaxID=1070780 RepID=UPI0022FEB203|nr:MFS general substrate transporter [Aspergillus affinis]KAI9035130.1 MFS general substrate transporter [Aspergillus affinis]